MPKTETQKWVFTERELKRLKEGVLLGAELPHANDEFIVRITSTFGRHRRNEAGITPNTFEIFVKRNGNPTNRFADGTTGVPEELKMLLDDVIVYQYIGRGHGPANQWVDVICDKNGNFIRLAE